MFNLDQAISDWRRQMVAGGIKAPEVLDELESHLRDDVEQQVRSGLSREQSFETATRRMGQTTLLRSEFEKADRAKRVRLRKHLLYFFGIAVGFFIFSVGFCYLVVLPLGSRAGEQYASWLGIPSPSPQAHFGFICRFVVGVCLGLTMPVGLLSLARIRILNHQKLISLRPYMMVVNLILGAVLTTPEVVTQLIMFVLLQLLCEVSILITRIWERRARKYA